VARQWNALRLSSEPPVRSACGACSYVAPPWRLRARRRCHRAGCLEFATTADLIDPGRVNLFGDWESQTAVNAFRRRSLRNKQGAAMRSASIAEYDIADVRPLSRKGRA